MKLVFSCVHHPYTRLNTQSAAESNVGKSSVNVNLLDSLVTSLAFWASPIQRSWYVPYLGHVGCYATTQVLEGNGTSPRPYGHRPHISRLSG